MHLVLTDDEYTPKVIKEIAKFEKFLEDLAPGEEGGKFHFKELGIKVDGFEAYDPNPAVPPTEPPTEPPTDPDLDPHLEADTSAEYQDFLAIPGTSSHKIFPIDILFNDANVRDPATGGLLFGFSVPVFSGMSDFLQVTWNGTHAVVSLDNRDGFLFRDDMFDFDPLADPDVSFDPTILGPDPGVSFDYTITGPDRFEETATVTIFYDQDVFGFG